jgi:hypothetical protein
MDDYKLVETCLDLALNNENDVKRFSKIFEKDFLFKKYQIKLTAQGQDMAKLR